MKTTTSPKEKLELEALVDRISARASDGRFYHFEDEDRELAIKFLNRLKLTVDNQS